MPGQLGTDTQIAEPRLARVNARLDEAFVAQKAARFEPFEQSVDFGDRSAMAVFAASLGAARMDQELLPKLETALVTLGEKLQRPRLQRAGLHASLTTFSLAGASPAWAAGSSGMPIAARTLFSISTARSGFSFRNSRALSLPWPIFSPL